MLVQVVLTGLLSYIPIDCVCRAAGCWDGLGSCGCGSTEREMAIDIRQHYSRWFLLKLMVFIVVYKLMGAIAPLSNVVRQR
jgi:hypothetical protein